MKKLQLVLIISLFFIGCASNPEKNGMELNQNADVTRDNIDKLFVVDCLLPGQVRALGRSANYITARRPIKTSALDCEIRGGEYVAFDRADYAMDGWQSLILRRSDQHAYRDRTTHRCPGRL